MRDMATRTLETLGMLYATTFGSEDWGRVLDAIADLVGGNGGLLFVHDEGPAELQISAASSHYLTSDVELYLEAHARDDELRWVRALDEAAPRTLMTDVDIWPDRRRYDAMPSVHFLRELDLYHRVAVRPCGHGGWKDALAVLFSARRGGIRPAESRRLALLVPHLARAIEAQRPFQLLLRRFGAVLAALDRLGLGVLIVREDGDVVVANREAERILDANDGLRLSARARLEATDGETDARLRSALQRADRAARLEEAERITTLELPRRAGGEPYLADVAPLRDHGGEIGAGFSGVLVVVVDPEHREMVSIEGLARSYGLSPTETLVCRMIAQGMTLREIAETRGVSFDTVKTQSRAIYAKTGTRNRRELVRRATSILPPLLDRHGRRVH
jgi:DNA-binding CsgD family transcriptional regulator